MIFLCSKYSAVKPRNRYEEEDEKEKDNDRKANAIGHDVGGRRQPRLLVARQGQLLPLLFAAASRKRGHRIVGRSRLQRRQQQQQQHAATAMRSKEKKGEGEKERPSSNGSGRLFGAETAAGHFVARHEIMHRREARAREKRS